MIILFFDKTYNVYLGPLRVCSITHASIRRYVQVFDEEAKAQSEANVLLVETVVALVGLPYICQPQKHCTRRPHNKTTCCANRVPLSFRKVIEDLITVVPLMFINT